MTPVTVQTIAALQRQPLTKRLPILKTLVAALHDDAIVLFGIFIVAAVGFANFGGPLTEQNLFVWVMVVAGSYLLAGRKFVEFAREVAYSQRGLIASGVGAAIDEFEAATGQDIDDDIEVALQKAVIRYLTSLKPQKPIDVASVLERVKQIAREAL